MSEDQNSAVIQLLTNQGRDIGQIKTDLAVNTTKTSAIESHLGQLNSKVAKQEAINAESEKRFNVLEEAQRLVGTFINEQQSLKRRRSDSRNDLLQKLFLMAVGPFSIAIWQIVQYLIHQGVFK